MQQVPFSPAWLAKIKDPPINQLAAGRRTLNTRKKRRNASGPSCRRQRHPIDRYRSASIHTHGSHVSSLASYRKWQENDRGWPEKIQSPVVNLSTGQIIQSQLAIALISKKKKLAIASHGWPLKWSLHCYCFHRIATQNSSAPLDSAHRLRTFLFALPCAGACTASTRLIFFWLRQADRHPWCLYLLDSYISSWHNN